MEPDPLNLRRQDPPPNVVDVLLESVDPSRPPVVKVLVNDISLPAVYVDCPLSFLVNPEQLDAIAINIHRAGSTEVKVPSATGVTKAATYVFLDG